MLHTKIIDASKNEKIEISKAESFLNQSKLVQKLINVY